MKFFKIILSIFFISSVSSATFAIERDLGNNWCSDVRIHFFAGGAEGDGFAGIVQTGAENAIRDINIPNEIKFSFLSTVLITFSPYFQIKNPTK